MEPLKYEAGKAYYIENSRDDGRGKILYVETLDKVIQISFNGLSISLTKVDELEWFDEMVTNPNNKGMNGKFVEFEEISIDEFKKIYKQIFHKFSFMKFLDKKDVFDGALASVDNAFKDEV